MSISQPPAAAAEPSRDAFKPMCLMPRPSQGLLLCTLAQPHEEAETVTIPELQLLAVGRETPPAIVIDCHGLDYLFSEDLSALLMLYKRVTEVGGSVVLCRLADAVARTLQLTRLDRLFRVFPDPAVAVCTLSAEAEEK